MLGWLRSKEQPSRAELLAAVPVRNQLVKQRRAGGSKKLGAAVLRLTAPLQRGRLADILARGEKAEKSFELDELGAFVWESVDGKRAVEQVIVRFADVQRVNVREAEVAVLAFLKTLAQRNLIGLVVEGKRKDVLTKRETRAKAAE